MINLTVICDKCGKESGWLSPVYPTVSVLSVVSDLDGFKHDKKKNAEYCNECIDKNKTALSTTIKFNGCQFLDFSDNFNAKKQSININGETKAFWLRDFADLIDVNPVLPSMVQFCCKREVILDKPTHCLSKEEKQCKDYVQCIHIVTVED